MRRAAAGPEDDARTRQREEVLRHVRDGTIELDQAAIVLGRSTRQVRRLMAAWLEQGRDGLVHGNRGRQPVDRTDAELRAKLVELATTTYAGVNRAHMADLLRERERIMIPGRTLRRILDEAGQPSPRPHRAPRHRSRRERARREGQLLQVDGSKHLWFGPEHPFATLVGAIDDATSRVTGGTFRAEEDSAGYLTVLTQTAAAHGLPWMLYSDRHGIFHRDARRPPTLTEQLTGKRSPTQVGRALEVAGIGWLPAGSPEAKGRVERLWGTLQGRLVTELRLAGITTIDAANAFLPGHLARHNERFTVPAADPEPAWRSWPEGLTAEAVFAFWYRRTVTRDSTLTWGQETLRVPAAAGGRTRAGQRLILAERLDGSLWADLEGRWERLTPAPASAPVLRARHVERPVGSASEPMHPAHHPSTGAPPRGGPHRPADDHPWRRPFKRR
jgi:transposase